MSTQRVTIPITMRCPHEIAEAMRRRAKEHDRASDGELVRAAKEYIARQQKPPREGERQE